MAKKSSDNSGKKSNKSRSKNQILQFFLLVISLTLIIYFLGTYHFIRTSNDTLVIRKLHFGFEDTYVDMRKWSTLDLFYHSEVEKAILKNSGQKILNRIKNTLNNAED